MLKRECKWSGRSTAINDTNTLCSINTQQQTSKAGTPNMEALSHATRREVASPLLLRSMLFPCSVMLSFCASCSLWLVFLLLCTAPLPYCVPLHLHLLASFPSSLLLGLRPCAGCQALESSGADSHGAFLLGWTSLLLQEEEQPCWKEQHCCWCWFLAVPVLRFSCPPPLRKHPIWLFCSSSLLVACFCGAVSGLWCWWSLACGHCLQVVMTLLAQRFLGCHQWQWLGPVCWWFSMFGSRRYLGHLPC